MATREIGIIVNGATGRIGSMQHLANALLPIRAEGGLPAGGDRILPRLLLLGRDGARLAALAERLGIADWTTELDAALSSTHDILFDAAATRQRLATLTKAIAAGKHVYSEKPLALSVAEGQMLLQALETRGLKGGVVEDKLYLPGLRSLARLAADGFFGRVVGFRLDFGWWVFDGAERASQRSSWNYRRSGGGGLILDMYPHWRYVIEGILGPIRRVVSAAATGQPERVDESGSRFHVDVEDTSATLVELEGGALGTVVCSWATRVRRDDLMTLQVDGTAGSAIAGLHRCFMQSSAETPTVRHFNPDVDLGNDYRADWKQAPAVEPKINPYRAGWELFLRHVAKDEPIPNDFRAGLRDIALAEACYRSAAEGTWATLDQTSMNTRPSSTVTR
jgi:predicted dehydrogenase